MSSIHIIPVPEGEEKECTKKQTELEKRMANTFPNLAKDINPEIPKAQ